MLNQSDYIILKLFKTNECYNEVESFTIKSISEKTKYSIGKVRNTIRILKVCGYITEGVIVGKSKTYYITELGKRKLLELYK